MLSDNKDFQAKKDYLIRHSKGKVVREKYFEELSKLFHTQVQDSMLIELSESDKLISERKESQEFEDTKLKVTILFDDKTALSNLMKQAYAIYSGEIIIWTDYSRYCGMIRLPNLQLFNTFFEFSSEHYGLLNIISYDWHNEIQLDYYEEAGEYYLELVFIGPEWNSETIDVTGINTIEFPELS